MNARIHRALDPRLEAARAEARCRLGRAHRRRCPSAGSARAAASSVGAVEAAIADGARSAPLGRARDRRGRRRAGAAARRSRGSCGARAEAPRSERLVVVGNGMVGHRFCETLAERDGRERCDIVVLGEEPRPAYDRVHLTRVLRRQDTPTTSRSRRADGTRSAASTLQLGERVVGDRPRRRAVVTAEAGERDRLRRARARDRLARRSCRRCPASSCPASSSTARSRTSTRSAPAAQARGARRVIGGGLLGLEAAKAVRDLGLETHVVEVAPRLMPRQLDAAGGEVAAPRASRRSACTCTSAAQTEAIARRRARRRGAARSRTATTLRGRHGRSSRPASGRATSSRARPGSRVGERGGIVVDDDARARATRASSRSARCALAPRHDLRPGRARLRDGRRARRRPLRGERRARSPAPTSRPSSSCSASTSRASATPSPTRRRRGAHARRLRGPRARRLPEARALAPTARGCSAASWSATRAPYAPLLAARARAARALPERAARAALRRARRRRRRRRATRDDAQVCSCNNVTQRRDLRARSRERRCTTRRRRQDVHARPAPAAAAACRS